MNDYGSKVRKKTILSYCGRVTILDNSSFLSLLLKTCVQIVPAVITEILILHNRFPLFNHVSSLDATVQSLRRTENIFQQFSLLTAGDFKYLSPPILTSWRTVHILRTAAYWSVLFHTVLPSIQFSVITWPANLNWLDHVPGNLKFSDSGRFANKLLKINIFLATKNLFYSLTLKY